MQADTICMRACGPFPSWVKKKEKGHAASCAQIRRRRKKNMQEKERGRRVGAERNAHGQTHIR